jgi:predicted RNase H-like nuclease
MRERQMTDYVLGLDWIDVEHGWACCQLATGSEAVPALDVLPLKDQDSDRVRQAAKVVIDAPIGLPTGPPVGCKLRECDAAARLWVGAGQRSSVFPVPYERELAAWRENREAGLPQKQGHFRGLLPAIDSAEVIASRINANTLESHPELAFAALLGRPLPDFAAKKTLLGALVRLALLARRGHSLPLRSLTGFDRIETDNFIDAMAMAVIALDWHLAGTVDVLRRADGEPEPLGSGPGRTPLMALPARWVDPREQQPPSEDEMVAFAREWQGGDQGAGRLIQGQALPFTGLQAVP